ncbi:MAG: PqqD family protein [Alphaproteobacteria bacterium]|nr:PqqD family protein [Alphaproteobacteria bacterium]MBL7096557.1 PqqD family protein [Alphaproteobacteria bacterium]
MTVTLDTMLRRDAGIYYAAIGSEGVMLNVNAGLYHGLNDVGVRIWELLETPQTAAQIRDRLVDEFEVERQVCQAAVLDFVGELLERGIILAGP